MKIEIIDGVEARVVDRLGLRVRTFVRVGDGCWVGKDGSWADRELAIRIVHCERRSKVLVGAGRNAVKAYEPL